MDKSVEKMQCAYFAQQNLPYHALPSWYYCDNEHDANECAQLVLQGKKRATSTSLWWFKANQEPLPQEGDLAVVTTFAGEAVCIVKTVAVEIVPYNQISAEYAALEGEGDQSLAYWHQVHWPYYHRELAATDYTPSEDMPIVCEQFEVVFP
ncbi:ASCH domain-containing protein [Pseudoalteromonas sp. SSDWG2]|uniref:ASCH domain-containing protein n=1 Tax=Pseudoalteromonas sp. SSDWG2 TaxID=3139391 RepID=UPI003BAC5DA6